jgi:ABC-type sulfate transport system permease component
MLYPTSTKCTKVIIIIIIIIITVVLLLYVVRSYAVGSFAISWNTQHLPTAIPSIQGSLLFSLFSHFLCRESRSITT